jgi:hypothetical protein
MKILVGLFGIHYKENLNHWMGWTPTVDYKKSIENNKEFIFNHHDCTFFASTYNSIELENLISDYNIQRIVTTDLVNIPNDLNANWRSRNNTFKNLVKLILDSEYKEYDYILLTRFDLIFKQHITDFKFDANSFNISSRSRCGEVSNLCDDNFYVIHSSILLEFYNQIKDLDVNMWAHDWFNYLNPINYLIDDSFYSHLNPFYFINRN